MDYTFSFLALTFLLSDLLLIGAREVIFAVNCGGEAHLDSNGIRYKRDPLQGKIGTPSDFGKRLVIARAAPEDQVLYQTERYHHAKFGYEIPVAGDGSYVLVLKFSEVYFTEPNKKVFDVVLNKEHVVVSDLDIFNKVGRGVAHDEVVPFSIRNGQLYINNEQSGVNNGRIKVDFIKGYRDNPKINAILLIKGTPADIPQLAPLQEDLFEDVDTEKREEVVRKNSKSKRASGPRTPDPYAADDSSIMLPVFVAIGAFIPLIFCLCKL